MPTHIQTFGSESGRQGNDESAPSPGGYSGVACIFSNDSSRFFSLLPVDPDKGDAYNPFVKNLPLLGGSFSSNEGDTLLPSFTAAAVTNANEDGALPSSPSKSSPSGQPISAVSIGQDLVVFSTSGFFEDTSTVTPLTATLLGTETKDKEKDEAKVNTQIFRGDLVPMSTTSRNPSPQSTVSLFTIVNTKHTEHRLLCSQSERQPFPRTDLMILSANLMQKTRSLVFVSTDPID